MKIKIKLSGWIKPLYAVLDSDFIEKWINDHNVLDIPGAKKLLLKMKNNRKETLSLNYSIAMKNLIQLIIVDAIRNNKDIKFYKGTTALDEKLVKIDDIDEYHGPLNSNAYTMVQYGEEKLFQTAKIVS